MRGYWAVNSVLSLGTLSRHEVSIVDIFGLRPVPDQFFKKTQSIAWALPPPK